MTQLVLSSSIQSYLIQAQRFPLLTAEEEFELAVRFRGQNDLDAAHKLITSNLRFVVKIAMEYRNYGFRLADLVQEGNIGLMKAVKKFDPHKGYRLITYAVWWIRSHIQAFILKNWSLVRKGTAALKKRLFYQLNRNNMNIIDLEKYNHAPLTNLHFVKGAKAPDKAVELSTINIGHECAVEARDLSLDNKIGEEETTYLDMIPDTSQNQEDAIAMIQEQGIVKSEVSRALKTLNEKERYVIENRTMSDSPLSLQEIGNKFGISRERVRQIEKEVVKKLRQIEKLRMLADNA